MLDMPFGLILIKVYQFTIFLILHIVVKVLKMEACKRASIFKTFTTSSLDYFLEYKFLSDRVFGYTWVYKNDSD